MDSLTPAPETQSDEHAKEALSAFHQAARGVPAYQILLEEAGVSPGEIKTIADFKQLPVLTKRSTFQRFPIEQLCTGGQVGNLGTVLTSSGHSGVFAFGLTDADTLSSVVKWIDDLLDTLFQVRSRRTLLVNCLPMGVKVPSEVCTLAETSVRPDMAVALVKTFGRHFHQIVLVGETGFIKHVLELGRRSGIVWTDYLVHIIVGEEPLAENGRKDLETLLGSDPRRMERGHVISSMGVAELGLNLFYEAPPHGVLIPLRRALHDNQELRAAVVGPIDWIPSLFTYDPRRIFVEFDAGGMLLVTTLAPGIRVPLIRYMTGDRGSFLQFTTKVRTALAATGVSLEPLMALPVVAIRGRGDHVLAGTIPVYPEAVKEGLYREAGLAEQTTANFNLRSGAERARIRIQLAPGIAPSVALEKEFYTALSHHVRQPFDVVCERYESFGNGMSLDYERKFNYFEV